MIYVGIDPGLDGAIAILNAQRGTLEVVDMPTVEVLRNGKKKREVSAAMVAATLRDIPAINMAVLERVNAMPGQGVTSVFSFGRSAGVIEGVLGALNIPSAIVSPQKWQKHIGVRGGKDGARLRATEVFPAYANLFARKKHDGRADAALMAWYAMKS